jgi:hypothetical protein
MYEYRGLSMETLNAWLLEAAEGQKILGVVLGRRPWNSEWPEWPEGKLLSYEEAMPWLLIEFDDGFGSQGNPPLHAWTEDWVIGTENYDGSTDWFRIPRNPCDTDVCEPGGG